METLEEIVALKRRVGSIEGELSAVSRRLNVLEDIFRPEAPRSAVADTPPPLVHEPPMVVQAAAPSMPALVEPVPQIPRQIISPLPVQIEEPVPVVDLPPRENPLRAWLEPLQLWPPSEEANAEVRLAAWWATRVGALLAVIGVVFLGVYVSRNTAPWVRLLELCTVTGGVIALGSWLERKLPKFGAVIFGAGLALAYFTAFAAYGVAPVKVIDNPLVASGCELVVVTAILALSWRRNSELVATMAVALGYVTAFLALRGGPPGFGPWVVLALGAAAVTLRLAKTWTAPGAVAMPFAWLFLAAAAFAPAGGAIMATDAVWIWTTMYAALFFSMDWLAVLRGRELGTFDRAWQMTNASLAVVVGFFAALQVAGSALTEFYFGSAALLLLATWAWQRVGVRALVPVLACKAAGLVALGIIHVCHGHGRSLALLAQAFVLLVSARQSQMKSLRVATWVAGAAALAFFFGGLRALGTEYWSGETLAEIVFVLGGVGLLAAIDRWLDGGRVLIGVGSAMLGFAAVLTVTTWDTVGYAPALMIVLAAAVAGVAALLRSKWVAGITGGLLFAAAHAALVSAVAPQFTVLQLWSNELVLLVASGALVPVIERGSAEGARRTLKLVVSGLALVTLTLAFFKGFTPAEALTATSALGLVLVGLAPWAMGWPLVMWATPLLGFGIALFFGHGGYADGWLWAAAVLAWLTPVWLARDAQRLSSIENDEWRGALPAVGTALATAVTLLVMLNNLHGAARVLGLAGAAFAALALAWRAGLRSALEASWVFWLVAAGTIVDEGPGAVNWAVSVAMWLPAVGLVRWPSLASLTTAPHAWRTHAAAIQTTLAAITAAVLALAVHGPAEFLALAAMAAISFAVWRWGKVPAARLATGAQVAVAWLAAFHSVIQDQAQGWSLGLVAVLGTAVVVAVLAFVLETGRERKEGQSLRWVTAGGGLALACTAFITQRGEVALYATTGCGVAAVLVFLAGLFLRSRPHRLCALAVMALCIPRAFVVDLHSALQRILAFVALGVVLLWVGFSYHRFRHLIEDENLDEKKL